MNTQEGDLKIQPTLQATTNEAKSEETKTTAEEPKIHTAKDLREMQSKWHKKELQPLRDKVETLESEIIALQSQLDGKVANEDALKGQIADIDAQLKEGLADEGKSMFTKLNSQLIGLREQLAREKLEHGKSRTELTRRQQVERESIAREVSEITGKSLDSILQIKDLDKVRELLADLKATKAEIVKTEAKEEETKLPKISTPVSSGGTNDAVFWKQYGQPGYVPSSADHKRAKEILDKARQGG